MKAVHLYFLDHERKLKRIAILCIILSFELYALAAYTGKDEFAAIGRGLSLVALIIACVGLSIPRWYWISRGRS